MKALCKCCGQAWMISVSHKIDKVGYKCPHCVGKDIAATMPKPKKFFIKDSVLF